VIEIQNHDWADSKELLVSEENVVIIVIWITVD